MCIPPALCELLQKGEAGISKHGTSCIHDLRQRPDKQAHTSGGTW